MVLEDHLQENDPQVTLGDISGESDVLLRWDGFLSFLWEWDLLHSSVTLDPKPLRGPE